MADNPLEIPQHMRDLVEQNLKQAHAAYEQLMDFVTKAMGAWMGAMPYPMAAGFKDVQERVAAMAKQNADSAFAYAGKISNAQTLQDVCDASDAVCSRPNAGLRHADAGASKADRRSSPEAATRLIFHQYEGVPSWRADRFACFGKSFGRLSAPGEYPVRSFPPVCAHARLRLGGGLAALSQARAARSKTPAAAIREPIAG